VGAGAVAARKIGLLLEGGAHVTVVATHAAPNVCRMAESGQIHLKLCRFAKAHLARQELVVAATGDAQVNRRVSQAAQRRGIWVNVVDSPELCSFFFPAIVRRPPVTVAVGTGGASPTLARLLRARIERLLPAGIGRLAEVARELRQPVRERLPVAAQRQRFWPHALTGPAAALALAGDGEGAAQALRNALDARAGEPSAGSVALVGAGPGDPGLLTLRACALLEEADVVVHDRLVSAEILAHARRDAERINVGKASGSHACDQAQIHRLLVQHARAGKRVVRLQGGDPLLFGRGGEELAALAQAGIAAHVVPGVTAALGCAAYAGIPLTHRECAHGVTFVTGHLRRGLLVQDWARLARPGQTLVIYMGLQALPELARQLIAHGAPPTLPGALIAHGTTPAQRVVEGTLEALPALAAAAGLEPPTLAILGEVVRLRVQPACAASHRADPAWLPWLAPNAVLPPDLAMP